MLPRGAKRGGRLGRAVPGEAVEEEIAARILSRPAVDRGVPSHLGAVGVESAVQAENQTAVEDGVVPRLGIGDGKRQNDAEAR